MDTFRAAWALALVLALGAGARGQASTDQPAPSSASAEPEDVPTHERDVEATDARKGILPIRDYSGDLLHRKALLGDLGGARTNLANAGVQFHIGWVQEVQSVVDGGRDSATKYGGSLDYLVLVDLYRMGVLPGALIKVRAETRYGESVNTESASILPVNNDAFFPLHTPLDETVPIAVTDVTYIQFLSEHFSLLLGKFDTLDSDPNEFASGRGNSQFMNTNFIFAPTLALLPYSTLGGGVIWIPSREIQVSSLVFDLNDSSTTTGFSDFGSEWAWATEMHSQYRLGRLPGGTNVGGVYAWNTDFFNFDGRFTFERGEGLVAPNKSDTWIIYASGWQYLYTQSDTDKHIRLMNGKPDLEGFGVFWRGSFADDDVNPTKWSLSGGIGGRGMIPSRPNDFYGFGYYYSSVQSDRLAGVLGLDDHVQGAELFYNIEFAPAIHLTVDAQAIDPVASRFDTAYVLGMRLKLDF